MEQKIDSFQYTYSAEQRAEVEKIRSKYVSPQENKMEQLRKLDRSAYQKAQAWSLVLGVVGTLLLGTGMSLIMSEFGLLLGLFALPVGIAAGLVGLVLVALAYPLYNRILKKERQRIAPEILRLTEELMQ